MMGMKKNEAARMHGQTNLLRPPISMCSVINLGTGRKIEGRRNYRDSSEFNDKIKTFATHGIPRILPDFSLPSSTFWGISMTPEAELRQNTKRQINADSRWPRATLKCYACIATKRMVWIRFETLSNPHARSRMRSP